MPGLLFADRARNVRPEADIFEARKSGEGLQANLLRNGCIRDARRGIYAENWSQRRIPGARPIRTPTRGAFPAPWLHLRPRNLLTAYLGILGVFLGHFGSTSDVERCGQMVAVQGRLCGLCQLCRSAYELRQMSKGFCSRDPSIYQREPDQSRNLRLGKHSRAV